MLIAIIINTKKNKNRVLQRRRRKWIRLKKMIGLNKKMVQNIKDSLRMGLSMGKGWKSKPMGANISENTLTT